jgi:hypothetical protein
LDVNKLMKDSKREASDMLRDERKQRVDRWEDLDAAETS